MPDSIAASPVPDEEVKRYTIHISSKYLNLTKQKLELTRLPREVIKPDQSEWWEPRSTVEPLVDYWLEQYSWRDQEAEFNAKVPQFRTAIRNDASEPAVRLHFIHSQSTRAGAVPLLLVPPFPFTALSLTHLVDRFTTPGSPADKVTFDVVIPSLPGLGFSDAIKSNHGMIPVLAGMLDKLMKRLGYQHYLATTAIASPNAVTDIDFRLVNHLAISCPESCLGVHLISPSFQAPRVSSEPWAWIKWKTAVVLRTPCLGYSHDDIAAFQQRRTRTRQPEQQNHRQQLSMVPSTENGARKDFEPNALSYALCDSPAGLLLFILMILRLLGPDHNFSHEDIIGMAELTWLPGPEGAMRLWAHCASNLDTLPSSSRKPRVGITTFSVIKDEESSGRQHPTLPISGTEAHTCLAWGKTRYEVVSSQRVSGSPGLLAWERPGIIVAGAKKLAETIIASDGRLTGRNEPGVSLLEQVIIGETQGTPAQVSGTTIQGAASPTPATSDVRNPEQVKPVSSP